MLTMQYIQAKFLCQLLTCVADTQYLKQHCRVYIVLYNR